jgi:3-phenylpropionate/trans-cinnamate dioxygenase ferredoxin reductase subunit
VSDLPVVIVGNGVAGMACARKLARLGGSPLVVGPGLPYDRPPLTKKALVTGARPVGDAKSLSARGIELLDGIAESVDVDARRVRVRTAGGDVEVDGAAIVLALGLRYQPPQVSGLEDAHVNATPQGFARLAPTLADGPKRVLIIGAGLIGTETAATLAGCGHSVTLVDFEERPLHRLHDPIPQIALETLQALGVTFFGGVEIVGAALGPSAVVSTASHDDIETEVVIAATGGRLPELSGIALPFPLRVDESMRVPELESIYAIGDCAAPPFADFGRIRLPHWDAAIGMGDRAADTIMADDDRAFDRLPYWWSDIGTRTISEVGDASVVVEWVVQDGLHLGRDGDGRIACVFLADDPKRLRAARELLTAARSGGLGANAYG